MGTPSFSANNYTQVELIFFGSELEFLATNNEGKSTEEKICDDGM